MTADEFKRWWRFHCNAFGVRDEAKTPEMAQRWRVRLEGIRATYEEALEASQQIEVDKYARQADHIELVVNRIKFNRIQARAQHRAAPVERPNYSPEF
ncbi:unnamed protein product, partial [marine sediment metagenome]